MQIGHTNKSFRISFCGSSYKLLLKATFAKEITCLSYNLPTQVGIQDAPARIASIIWEPIIGFPHLELHYNKIDYRVLQDQLQLSIRYGPMFLSTYM